jgi:hypothetical protein
VELPVVIEPLPEGRGFAAHLGAPFNLSAEAATADEAVHLITAQLQRRLQQGLEIRAVNVPAGRGAEPGWLPDDELTREWLQFVQQFRSECDIADRQRLLGEGEAAKEAS